MTRDDILEMYDDVFSKFGYQQGRMIGGSKSGYWSEHPDNEVYFNGNIALKDFGKVWWGDIDYTLDQNTLQEIANEIGQDLYILREMDGRFENEEKPGPELAKKAVQVVKAEV